MAKYRVLKNLSTANGTIRPGEVYELDDKEAASKLIAVGAIKPMRKSKKESNDNASDS